MNRPIRAVLGLALLAGCTPRPLETASMQSETVIYSAARVRTVDPARPQVTAFSVRDGRFLAVGTLEEVRAASGRAAREVALGEVTVVPGLEDAHGHLLHLGKALSTVALTGATSEREALERVKAAGRASFQGEWLIGHGWDQNGWSELGGAFPSKAGLDALYPKTPVVLTRIDGHAVWVNSEALRRAGLTRETADPEGGRIVRDAQGEPTGVLIDNAMAQVTERLPPLGAEERRAWLTAALSRCAQVGLTAVHDAGMDLATFTLLQQFDAVGALPLRLYVMADGQGKDAEAFLDRGPFQGRNLTLKAVKLFADGALGSRGAALHEGYSDEHGHTGLLLLSPEELERRARAFMAQGFQVNIHAIGDRANTLAVDVLERASRETNTQDRRHRIEHAQILRLEDLPRMKAAGLLASMQPTHATSDMGWAEARVGKARLVGAYAWRRILEAGIPLAFGSDFPIERPEPLHGLYAARTRQDAAGRPEGGWLPEQRLTGEEALHAFTAGAAHAAHAEDRRGRIAPGLDADFVVLDVDPVSDAPAAVRAGTVRQTVVGGKVLHHTP